MDGTMFCLIKPTFPTEQLFNSSLIRSTALFHGSQNTSAIAQTDRHSGLPTPSIHLYLLSQDLRSSGAIHYRDNDVPLQAALKHLSLIRS
jgi:hypothetical protein